MKSDIHDKIIDELHKKYGVSKYELNKVVASEWRTIERIVTNKECKNINCIFLGKFYPTKFRRSLEEKKNDK